MNPLIIGLLVMLTTIGVLASGIPVAFGLGLVAVIFLMIFEGFASLDVLATTFFHGLQSLAWCRSRCSSSWGLQSPSRLPERISTRRSTAG